MFIIIDRHSSFHTLINNPGANFLLDDGLTYDQLVAIFAQVPLYTEPLSLKLSGDSTKVAAAQGIMLRVTPEHTEMFRDLLEYVRSTDKSVKVICDLVNWGILTP